MALVVGRVGLLGDDGGGHSEKVEVDSTTKGVEIKVLANGGGLRDRCEEIQGCV